MKSLMPNPPSDNPLNLINLSELSERVNIKTVNITTLNS